MGLMSKIKLLCRWKNYLLRLNLFTHSILNLSEGKQLTFYLSIQRIERIKFKVDSLHLKKILSKFRLNHSDNFFYFIWFEISIKLKIQRDFYNHSFSGFVLPWTLQWKKILLPDRERISYLSEEGDI